MAVTSLNKLYLGGRQTGGLETCHTLRAKAIVTLRAVGTHGSRHFPSLRAQNDSVHCSDFEFLSLLSWMLLGVEHYILASV